MFLRRMLRPGRPSPAEPKTSLMTQAAGALASCSIPRSWTLATGPAFSHHALPILPSNRRVLVYPQRRAFWVLFNSEGVHENAAYWRQSKPSDASNIRLDCLLEPQGKRTQYVHKAAPSTKNWVTQVCKTCRVLAHSHVEHLEIGLGGCLGKACCSSHARQNATQTRTPLSLICVAA